MKNKNNIFNVSYLLSAKRYPLIILLILFSTPLFAADDQNQNPGVVQAKEDYREFLKQLKVLNQQYMQVTGEIKNTLKEEGVPQIDEETGEFGVKPFVENETKAEPARVIRQTKQDMTVQLELPGLKKESISVRIEDGQFLRVNADEKGIIGAKHIEKIIQLPTLADENGSEAKYEDGILTVRVLKAAKKEIPIPVH